MQNNSKVNNAMSTDMETMFETSRWTSGAYEVQFGQIGVVEVIPEQSAPFQMSAWGVSKDLRELLGDYSDSDIRRSVEWLMLQQTHTVVDMLERISMEQGYVPPLENLFISVEGELYFARGLKLLVTCITNIVPHGDEDDGLDKFVAVLDPGEARNYVDERRGLSSKDFNETLH